MAFGRLKVDQIETSTQIVDVDAVAAITADGDKGDITIASGGTRWTIDNGSVSTAKLGGDITTAGKALLDDVDAAAQRTTLGLAAVASTGAYSDLTGKPTIPSAADATPQPLGVATVGISADYAREDHAHAMPSAADVGADPVGTSASGISAHEAAADPHPNYALESSLGGAALLNVGTTSGTVAAGDDNRFVPSGGTTGQALTKTSGTDYDASWQDITTAIDDLTDVTITSVADGEVLTYDSVSGQWINATPTGGSGTPGGSDTQIQYNSSGSFAGSADLTWDDTAKELGVGGDINLDDGGTFATTLQLITPTANRTISFPDATGTVALVGGSSGQLVYNNAGAYAGGPLYSPTTGTLGYPTGGTITQATSKSTGVTLNGASGRITLNAAALNADTTVSFTLTNSSITANDLLVLNHVSGGTAGAYLLNAQAAAGSASINVRNITAGSLSEAIVIGFAILKS